MNQRRSLLVVAVLGVVARVAFSLYALQAPNRYLFPDSKEYLALAGSLVAGRGFSQGPAGLPETFRVPGVPFILALLQWLVGPNQIPAFLLLQAVLVLLPAVLLLRLLPRDGRDRGRLVLVAVLCFDPLSLGLSTSVLSETTFLVLAGIRLAALLRCASGAGPGVALLCGVTSGAMVLVRPIGSFLWIADGLSLWLMAGRSRSRQVLAALLGFGLAVSPWVIRNDTHGVHGIASGGGPQLLMWNAAIVESHARGISLEDTRAEFAVRYAHTRDPAREALAVFADRPWDLAHVSLLSVVALVADPGHQWLLKPLGLPGSGVLSGRRGGGSRVSLLVLIASAAWACSLWALAVRGLQELWAGNRPAFWACALTILYFVLLSLHVNLAEGARFRAPVVPALALLAAYGVSGSSRSEDPGRRART